MAAPGAEFDKAVELHRAGRLDEAEAAYKTLLAKHPAHFDARHLIGVIASQRGQFDQAAELIQLALTLDERQPNALVNLGNALMGAGRANEAEDAYRRAVALKPDLPEAWFGLGNAMRGAKPDEAVAAYRKAIAFRAGFVEAMANLAALHLAQGRAQDSLDLWLQASQQRPTDVKLYVGAAKALAALDRLDEAVTIFRGLSDVPSATVEDLFEAGNALAAKRRFEDAAALYGEILRRDPKLFPALNNLGNMLRELNRLEEAEAAYRRALDASPSDAGIICNRALILRDLGRVADAAAECKRSIAIKPTAIAHSNLGLIHMSQGQVSEALAQFAAAEALAPDDADIRFHHGVALLHLGRFTEGWPRYEARWGQRRARERQRYFDRPQWMGEEVEGRTVLIHAEQGFGDTLQFVRYAPLLARRGARVILECQPALARLMAGVERVEQVVPRGAALPPFDLHAPLMSLPLAFGTTLETIPADIPYLRPPAEALDSWADLAADHREPRIGLVWAGDARHYDVECNLTDKRRSVTLEAFAPLMSLPGARFFSLQVGPAAAQAQAFPQVIDHTARIKDFTDTAALISHLDLVISVDTSVAHLAGALGKPVWVLSRFDNCWRWMVGREDSPWYPTLRLYRQPAPRAWGPVFDRLAADLRQWLDAAKRP